MVGVRFERGVVVDRLPRHRWGRVRMSAVTPADFFVRMKKRPAERGVF
jgi:hypothetical protein